jgi:hypothetical protein
MARANGLPLKCRERRNPEAQEFRNTRLGRSGSEVQSRLGSDGGFVLDQQKLRCLIMMRTNSVAA